MTARNQENRPRRSGIHTVRRVLVMNCHEPWVFQLSHIDADLHVVTDLPGRAVRGWDAQLRPVPPNARFITLQQALKAGSSAWDLAVCHNVTDLLDLSALELPKLLVLHSTLQGRMAQQDATFDPQEMVAMLATYLQRIGGHAVGVTQAKAASWGIDGEPLLTCADPADYLTPTYELPMGLRVANSVVSKRVFLAWDFHEQAFGALPVRLIGHNPELGITAANGWDDLKRQFASHRFQVHTADPAYEDGFNMAVAEGLAAGLPLITNTHPTSPVVHGVNGFQARTPAEAQAYARQLLDDPALARRLGAAARGTARQLYSVAAFRRRFADAAAAAVAAFQRRAGVSATA
jgi:hypothetical protein